FLGLDLYYHVLVMCLSQLSKFMFFLQVINNLFLFFFFNDPATTEIYTLSLHDALPISIAAESPARPAPRHAMAAIIKAGSGKGIDRKSTRLNSSHRTSSYAVFCLKKKKTTLLLLG